MAKKNKTKLKTKIVAYSNTKPKRRTPKAHEEIAELVRNLPKGKAVLVEVPKDVSADTYRKRVSSSMRDKLNRRVDGLARPTGLTLKVEVQSCDTQIALAWVPVPSKAKKPKKR